MLYKGYKTMHDFTKFKMIWAFGDAIRNGSHDGYDKWWTKSN